MKRLLLLVFFSALLFTQLLEAEKLSLAVFEFQAMEGIRHSDAVQIGEVVLNELIRTEAFRVVEQSQISKLMEEMSFQLSSLTTEMIIEIGKRLDVDFILAGSIGLFNGEIIVFLRILATEDGSYFLSEYIKTSPDCVLQDVIDFTGFIAYRAGQRISGNVAKRIESLISLGKIKEAEDLIRNAKALRHEDVSIIILEDKIKIATVEMLKKSYLKAVKENDVEQAVYLIDEIIRYGGNYSIVSKYIEEVDKIKAIREEEQKLKQLETIETFLDREQHEEAEKALDLLLVEHANVEPELVKELKSRLQLLRGMRYFKRAKNEFICLCT